MMKPCCDLDSSWMLDSVNSDEFDGNTLDAGKWYDYAPGWRGRKEFIFRRNNVSVSNGSLLLEARSISRNDMEPEDLAAGILPNTMPVVKSRNKVLYGYFECRSKGCNAEVRNAFWLYDPLSDDLQAKYTPGNCSEEIDIYEFIGKFKAEHHPPYVLGAAVHRFATPYVEGIANGLQSNLPDKVKLAPVDFSPADAFHTYSLLWTPFEIVWFADGKEFHRRINDYFHRPMHVVFDCEIAKWGGAEVSNFNPEDSPAVHEVRYFRRWNRDWKRKDE